MLSECLLVRYRKPHELLARAVQAKAGVACKGAGEPSAFQASEQFGVHRGSTVCSASATADAANAEATAPVPETSVSMELESPASV